MSVEVQSTRKKEKENAQTKRLSLAASSVKLDKMENMYIYIYFVTDSHYIKKNTDSVKVPSPINKGTSPVTKSTTIFLNGTTCENSK